MEKKQQYALCRREMSDWEEVPRRYCNKSIVAKNVFDFCPEHLAKVRGMWPKDSENSACAPGRL